MVTSRGFRLAIVGSMFATLLLLALPSAASANALAAKKAQARAAAAQIAGLDQRLDQTVATYAAAMQRLQTLQSQVGANRSALRLDRYMLTVSQQQLAEHLVSAYKGGGAGVLNALFQTGSFDDLLTRLDYVQQLTGSDATMVQAVAQHRRQVAAEQSSLQKALQGAQTTTAQLAAQRGRLNAQLGERRAILRGLNAAVGRLVAQARAVTPVAASSPASGAAPSTAGDGSGPWWPQIKSAAAAQGIWAEGLYRLMNCRVGRLRHGLQRHRRRPLPVRGRHLEGLLEPLALGEHLRRRRPDQGHRSRHPPGVRTLLVAVHLRLGLLAPVARLPLAPLAALAAVCRAR